MEETINPGQVSKALESFLSETSHYENYLRILEKKGWDVRPVRETVSQALDKVKAGVKSFVIYGEPQSGKTALMIGLTSKLLDVGRELIVILLNDSTKLLEQNLDRFVDAQLKPTPRKATDVYDQGGLERRSVLFCKKNTHDLRKLTDLIKDRAKVIIDDEADHASPNAKINRNERTRINEAIARLIEGRPENIYIGVTATPARLDLNNTFNNDNEEWVQLKPHRDYVGMQEIFFEQEGKYHRLPVSNDEDGDLEKAVIAFVLNVVYLNSLKLGNGKDVENYCFLIHTSGRRIDHQTDADIVRKVLNALADEAHPHHKDYIQKVRQYVDKRAEISAFGTDLMVRFVKQYIPSQSIVIMNSNFDTTGPTTTPPAMFTFYIGGNVVSRGVTFDNLLGMFFTRSGKHSIQQDTYIQRARMLGSRKSYIKYFQLWIPDQLFSDWRRCFIYHHISLESIWATGAAPIWISGDRLVPASASSIDKRNILIEKGEVASPKFNYSDVAGLLEEIVQDQNTPELERLEKLRGFLSIAGFLGVIKEFIKLSNGAGVGSNINIIKTRHVDPSEGEYHDNLYRPKGVMGGREYKDTGKDHHIMFIANQRGEGRMIYRYSSVKLRTFTKVRVRNGN